MRSNRRAEGGADFRIGEGSDLHRLESGRRLVIGCIEVPSDVGSFGHSDGDVVAHAVCDAVLGALALGDIGTHFPPTDERWRGADSRVFLAHAMRLARERGARIVNVDVTVELERPKLAPYLGDMCRELARVLGCAAAAVSVKAKTAEGLGAVGEGKAIAARAVVLLAVRSST